jgi:signal transduction histidine kinase
VHITIDDDGPGIAAADRDRVFERFTRLDASRTRGHTGGAGLGLAMVRSVVERHHGTITVADAPSGGARLQVTLPALADGDDPTNEERWIQPRDYTGTESSTVNPLETLPPTVGI